MRKEILISIFGGLLLGIIIAYGIWRANLSLKPPSNNVTTLEQKGFEKSQNEFKISLTQPNENEVVQKSPTKFIGITKPNSWLVISTEEEDYVFQNNKEGTFEQEVDLGAGINQVLLYVFDEAGLSIKNDLTLVFSTQLDDSSPEGDEQQPAPENENADEENQIEEKVKEKIQNVQNNPTAYLGTITDIAENTVQIKSHADEIKQISVDIENTSFANIGNSNTDADFEDLAIGDFIVAMGFLTNGNGVLDAKRILITSVPEEPTRTAALGKIKGIEKKVLTLETTDQNEVVVEFPKRWKGPEISELEEGEKVIVVYEPDEEDLIIRTVEKLSTPIPSS